MPTAEKDEKAGKCLELKATSETSKAKFAMLKAERENWNAERSKYIGNAEAEKLVAKCEISFGCKGTLIVNIKGLARHLFPN